MSVESPTEPEFPLQIFIPTFNSLGKNIKPTLKDRVILSKMVKTDGKNLS
jgi:hypothetical protein